MWENNPAQESKTLISMSLCLKENIEWWSQLTSGWTKKDIKFFDISLTEQAHAMQADKY